MASTAMFSETPSFKKAVMLINALDSAKFPLILSRILQKLHSKVEHSFSEEEEEKLQTSLSLDSSDVQLVLNSLAFIFEQAAYHMAKPAILAQQLQQISVSKEKIEAIVLAWTNGAKEVVGKLRVRSIAPKQLEHLDWNLHLQMAQCSQSKEKIPLAIFDLDVKNEVSQEMEHIQVEFNHKELYEFYNQIETIQAQLDSLQ